MTLTCWKAASPLAEVLFDEYYIDLTYSHRWSGRLISGVLSVSLPAARIPAPGPELFLARSRPGQLPQPKCK